MMSVVGITRCMLSFCFLTNLEKHKVIRFGKEKAENVYQLVLGGLKKRVEQLFTLWLLLLELLSKPDLVGHKPALLLGLGGTHTK